MYVFWKITIDLQQITRKYCPRTLVQAVNCKMGKQLKVSSNTVLCSVTKLNIDLIFFTVNYAISFHVIYLNTCIKCESEILKYCTVSFSQKSYIKIYLAN